jgi:hypothetical protein
VWLCGTQDAVDRRSGKEGCNGLARCLIVVEVCDAVAQRLVAMLSCNIYICNAALADIRPGWERTLPMLPDSKHPDTGA